MVDLDQRVVSHRRASLWLGGGAAAWAAAYAVNEVAWSALFTDGLGLDLQQPVVGSVHFFLYDTTKIGLLLVGLMLLCRSP